MKGGVSSNGAIVDVILSRRNLLSLLHKLDMPGSARTLFRDVDGLRLVVRAETDEEHYAEREPGAVHPETEKFVKERS